MNHLVGEKSPYLLQHAGNPVDWHFWGEAAFAKAKAEGKPIFLSIGYSTCHWCHVMAHESFEDPAIAALLNEHFVPVKVDREERPDIDRIYMSYVQALTGHGGWPLSAWLTPDLKPFYGGTYFPPEDRHGRPGFPAILKAIAKGWNDDRLKLVAEADRVIEVLKGQSRAEAPQSGAKADDTSVEGLERLLAPAASDAFNTGFEHLVESFDREHGGFGGAPKFPRAGNLSFLMRCAALQGVAGEAGSEAVRMCAVTMEAMARGGIHDHVGGGFHRYGVDEGWFVPHFEKMLYDQAQIAMNAMECWQATGDERHAWLVRDILDYVLRDMNHPEGGFYSAEDADSEGKEGAFYVWTKAEIDSLLGADSALFCAHYAIRPDGNVLPGRDPHGEFAGKNILATHRPLSDTAKELGLGLQEASDRLAACLEKLRAARSKRPRPHLDDKILTAWNGLMISAFAKASALPAESLADQGGEYLVAAGRAAGFIRRELFDAGRGVLLRTWRKGPGSIEGFAEDYAFLIQGLLDLYEAGFDIGWLQWAEALQAKMDALFWDEARGGYFNSPAGAVDVVVRLKEDYDGAEPAPSSVAAMNLLRLDGLLSDAGLKSPLRERAIRTLEGFRPRWHEAPQALPQMLCALEWALEPPRHLVLAGDPAAVDFQAMAKAPNQSIGRRMSVLAADGGAGQSWLVSRAPWLAAMKPIGGRPTAFLCQGFACEAPVTELEALKKLLL